jgi:hypothetical protein
MNAQDAVAAVERVSYREGQVVTAADLTAEQEYLIAMRQTHAATNHTWGIAQGLDLSMRGDTLNVSAGTAVDGLGRLLIVPDEVQVGTGKLSGDEFSVWLLFALEPAGNGRAREVTRIRLCPGTVPTERQPEASGADWPVYLGALRRSAAGASLTVQSGVRPLIGLVGAGVRAASGAALMRSDEDFAIALPVPGGEPGSFSDQFRIGSNGSLLVSTNLRFTGDVHVNPNPELTPSGRQGVGFGAALPQPKAACPWSVYHAQAPRDGLPTLDELVFELQGPQEKEDPSGLRAAMGHRQDGRFQAALTLASDGTVTIPLTLQVEGRLIESPIGADPSDPRFLVAMASAAAGGATDALPRALSIEVVAGASLVHTAVQYTIKIANTGIESIDVIQVQEFATLNGLLAKAPSQTPPEPIGSFTLSPSGSRSWERTLSVDTPGKLAIGVTVLGVGPSGPLNAKNAVEIEAT